MAYPMGSTRRQTRRRALSSFAIALVAAGCSVEQLRREGGRALSGKSSTEELEADKSFSVDPYPLDAIDREVTDAGARVQCDREGLVQYSGTSVKYHGPVEITPPFQERLERFERVVVEVATEFYGRPPRRVRHMGAFSCRTSRNRSYRLSEHALGNAIDVAGFDFGPASAEQPLADGLPERLAQPFEVRVLRHWDESEGVSGTHARFLRELTARLTSRRDIFRSAIGPAHPGHHDHFHFDMSPWRFVRL